MSVDSYCVMGNPVAHSRSPWIHARFAELTGQAMTYGRRLVPLDGFAAALAAFHAEGGLGCNITVPFKFEAAALVDSQTGRAELAQAANTLHWQGGRLLADNTDGMGLLADIQTNAGFAVTGRDVLLLGAGGAAAGVLGPLLQAAPRRLVVSNRTAQRARDLVQRHAALAALQKTELLEHAQPALLGNFDLIVNATAASLAGAGVPVPASVLKPGALVVDMMYGPSADGFLAWAAEHGAQPRDGLGMLVEQAAQAFAIWRGVRPPAAQVLVELRAQMRLNSAAPAFR